MGDVKGAWLGISFQEISENLSLKLNLNDTKGVIVTQIDEKNIENIEDYYDALANISSGDIVLVGVTTVNQSRNFSQTYSRYIAIKVD